MPATIEPVKAWLKTVDDPKQIEAASLLLQAQWAKLRRQRWLATLKSVYVGDPVVPVESWLKSPSCQFFLLGRDKIDPDAIVVVRKIDKGKQVGVWLGVRGHSSWHNPRFLPGGEFDCVEFRFRVPGEG
jgi:hypothetical protein